MTPFRKTTSKTPKPLHTPPALAKKAGTPSISKLSNALSEDDPPKQSASVNYINRSNYFNSMCSEQDFSKFEFDDREWIRKSMHDVSQDESFYGDHVLPDKLATRLKTFMENDAERGSLMNSEDESQDQKMLERGKEIVRKSGLEVDFSGKLVSKEMIREIPDSFQSRRTQNTSLDLGLSKENRFWLEQKPVEEAGLIPLINPKANKRRVSQYSRDSASTQNKQSSIHDIQGITSTKYSDLYCQDKLEQLNQKKLQVPSDVTLQQKSNEEENTSQVNRISIESASIEIIGSRAPQVKMGRESRQRSDQIDSQKKSDLKKIITFDSMRSSKMKIDSLDYSGTDIFENGSFLNMGGNDSLVIAHDTGLGSNVDSAEKYPYVPIKSFENLIVSTFI